MSGDGAVRVRVSKKTVLADGVVGVRLEPAAGAGPLPPWEPGAHIDIGPSGGPLRRYSLCGVPGETGCWEIAVLRVAGGRGGSAWVHDQLRPGDELVAHGPRNHFPLQDAPAYLFIAGGIGITPLVPMIRALAARARGGGDSGTAGSGAGTADLPPWRLAYGGRTRRSMTFAAELAAYGAAVQLLPQDEAGLLDLPAILGPEVPGRRVYCCGPEPLLRAIESVMSARPAETLHLERFTPKADDAPGPAPGADDFTVRIASTGQLVHVPSGVSIIDALASAGLEVGFSCGEGTCGTCETRVLGGVPRHRDSVLTPEEQARGDCMMICVGRCVTGPLILDL